MGGCHLGEGLEEEGGFADAGFAAEEDGGAGDDAAAEDAVEFGDAGGDARDFERWDVGDGGGFAVVMRAKLRAGASGRWRRGRVGC